jgi:hypothetical protein
VCFQIHFVFLSASSDLVWFLNGKFISLHKIHHMFHMLIFRFCANTELCDIHQERWEGTSITSVANTVQ